MTFEAFTCINCGHGVASSRRTCALCGWVDLGPAPSSPSGADDVEALVDALDRAWFAERREAYDAARAALLNAIRDREERARDPDARVKKGFRIGIESAARCVENFGGAAACDLAAEIRALSSARGGTK